MVPKRTMEVLKIGFQCYGQLDYGIHAYLVVRNLRFS